MGNQPFTNKLIQYDLLTLFNESLKKDPFLKQFYDKQYVYNDVKNHINTNNDSIKGNKHTIQLIKCKIIPWIEELISEIAAYLQLKYTFYNESLARTQRIISEYFKIESYGEKDIPTIREELIDRLEVLSGIANLRDLISVNQTTDYVVLAFHQNFSSQPSVLYKDDGQVENQELNDDLSLYDAQISVCFNYLFLSYYTIKHNKNAVIINEHEPHKIATEPYYIMILSFMIISFVNVCIVLMLSFFIKAKVKVNKFSLAK